MAKQFMKDNIIPILTMIVVSVGLATTAVNTGRASGRVEESVKHLEQESVKVCTAVETVKTEVSSMKEKQAFLEGVVSTQLETQGDAIVRIEKKLDDLERVD